jgi:hypothetical protein
MDVAANFQDIALFGFYQVDYRFCCIGVIVFIAR